MRKLSAFLVVFLAFNAHGAEAPTVLIFGDSLSAGYGIDVDQSWSALLQSRLEAQGYEHRVVNASVSGETTEGGVAGIQAALDSFKPVLVILELGGNDGLRGIPAARMKANLEKIIRASRASGAAVVMLGIRIPSNYGPRYRDEFENAFRDVAASCKIRWIEFFMEGIAENPELMQKDGIHPNAAAQARLLDNAWPIIRAALDDRNRQ
jgi:acyl-CoA thioesterase I